MKIISRLDLQKTNNFIVVTYHEVCDEGNLEWLDLYAFSFVDPDMEFETDEFETVEEATNYIRSKYKLSKINFLKKGGVQTEYKKLLISEERE